MNIRSPLGVAMAALIVVVGLAIGAWLAAATRPGQRTQTVAVSTSNSGPAVARSKAPRPVATPIAAPARTATPEPVRTVAPTTTPTLAPTLAPATAPPAATAVAATSSETLQSTWQIAEANVGVGTIVWAGRAVSRGNTIMLEVHKESIGGRPAVPCERKTYLHAAFSAGVAQQTVPYQEINCQGVASSGEVHIRQFSSDGHAFSGSFWRDGVKLGDFDARQQ